MKIKLLAAACAATLAPPSYAEDVVFEYDFTVAYLNELAPSVPGFSLGDKGTGQFGFQEAFVDAATAVSSVNAQYGRSTSFVDVTFKGVTTRVVDYRGDMSGANGPLIQDLPSREITYDAFQLGRDREGVRLAIYGRANTQTGLDLTADAVQALWANRVDRPYVYIVNNRVLGEITDIRLVSAVPEPATWFLMILGLGAVGVTMRLRSDPTQTLKAR